MKLQSTYFAAVLVALGGVLATLPSSPEHHWPVITSDDAIGLRSVDCWFGDLLPQVECYDMQVPERHGDPESRIVTFAVMVVPAAETGNGRSPLLHLGAGGPGAPMYLDHFETVRELIRRLDQVSLQQGRDLVVIDPRGTGLARPRLGCRQFVENERERLSQQLSLTQTRDAVVADYRSCIDEYRASGVDFAGYNSFAVAADIEALRRAIATDRWVLLGISYGANYALTIADQYPATVEAMVLDSAFVSRTDFSQRYLDWITQPYQRLFNYCQYDPACSEPIPRVRERFWALYESLNRTPIETELEYGGADIPLVIDGERFLAAIIQGIYGVEIYRDLPRIIAELERGEFDHLQPYLWFHVDYMLDDDWGDVSEMAHYCYESKPFTDFARIRDGFASLPQGYLRDTADFYLDWPDHCKQMQIDTRAPHRVPSHQVNVPTLFLHGRFDSVTPLAQVREIQPLFDHAHLLTFDLGHSILNSSSCALNSASIFVDNPDVDDAALHCH